MEKAIRLLEHRRKDREQEGTGKEQLEKTQDSLNLMKRKLGGGAKGKGPRSTLNDGRMMRFLH